MDIPVDNKEARPITSETHKCPSCGGKLIFNPEIQLLICNFCENTYSPGKIEVLELIRPADEGAADEAEEDIEISLAAIEHRFPNLEKRSSPVQDQAAFGK